MSAGARLRIGLAGWSEAVGRQRASFPGDHGTGLARYATRFDFVEINASFYRAYPAETYAKWAAATPPAFLFAVKTPRRITHFTRLKEPDLLGAFFEALGGLGEKLAVVLVQLPPSLVFDPVSAATFFDALRGRHGGAVVVEPRHPSWVSPEAREMLSSHRVGLVRTEIPAPGTVELRCAKVPVYVRLHGAPRRYYSSYGSGQLARLAEFLRLHARRDRFVVFDNTAAGAAVRNALALLRQTGGPTPGPPAVA